jgi:hypothetical protein
MAVATVSYLCFAMIVLQGCKFVTNLVTINEFLSNETNFVFYNSFSFR